MSLHPEVKSDLRNAMAEFSGSGLYQKIKSLDRQFGVLIGSVRVGDSWQQLAVPDGFDRPFGVFKAINVQTGKMEIVKTVLNDGFRNRLDNADELITGVLRAQMPDWPHSLRDAFYFPKIVRRGRFHDSMVSEFVPHASTGTHHEADPEIFTKARMGRFAKLFRQVQKEAAHLIGNPKFEARYISHLLKKYHADFDKKDSQDIPRVTILKEQLGSLYIEKMDALLNRDAQTAELLAETAPVYFVMADTTPGNMGLMADGRVVLFDADRCTYTQSPSYDVMTVFAALWTSPEAQEELIYQAVLQNSDIDTYLALARLDFIFNRGSGELAYWLGELNKATDAKDEKGMSHCRQAVDRLSLLMLDAMNQRGIWNPQKYGLAA